MKLGKVCMSNSQDWAESGLEASNQYDNFAEYMAENYENMVWCPKPGISKRIPHLSTDHIKNILRGNKARKVALLDVYTETALAYELYRRGVKVQELSKLCGSYIGKFLMKAIDKHKKDLEKKDKIH